MNPIEANARSGRERLILKVRGALALGATCLIMGAGAVVIAAAQLVSRGRARRWCQNVVVTAMARAVLRLIGVRIERRDSRKLLEGSVQPCVYIINHSSTLDMPVVAALGLPNVRAFMSRKLRAIVPLGALVHLLGHFFLAPQSETQARREAFAAACETLRRSGDSVFLTPEGTRYVGDQIGPFNRGAFHLAVALRWPIVPIWMEVPPEIDPGKGFSTRPGTVVAHTREPVDTSAWSLETLDEHIAAVRALYLELLCGWD